MPMSFDTAPGYTLHGLFRPALDFLDRLPFCVPAAVAAAVALVVAVLVLERLRSRSPSPCIPGGSASLEGTLGHLRQVKAELKGRRGEAAVAAVLARAGFPALHDVTVRDAWGLTQVDHLVRLADGIAVPETKAFTGMVTGFIRDQLWMQHLREGEVRTEFLSSLLQNHRHVQAARELAGAGVLVFGLVVSAGAGRFCGELGAVVIRLDELVVRLQAAAARCEPARVDAAWARLTAAAACGAALRRAHGEQMRRRRGEVC